MTNGDAAPVREPPLLESDKFPVKIRSTNFDRWLWFPRGGGRLQGFENKGQGSELYILKQRNACPVASKKDEILRHGDVVRIRSLDGDPWLRTPDTDGDY